MSEKIEGYTPPNETGLTMDSFPKDPKKLDSYWESTKRMHEDLKVPGGEQKTQNAINKAQQKGFLVGVKVKFRDGGEIGKIVGYNTRNDGFYPGSRYPVIVESSRGTFEYGIHNLKLLKENK